MDEYLSEKEQLERLRQWWSENGWYLIGGVAIGALALFGWNQYTGYQERRSEEAAALYLNLQQAVAEDRAAEAEQLLERLRADYGGNAYTDQAGLMMARMHMTATAPDRAAAELRYVMENSDDPDLALVARLRLARVLAYREQYQDALALLEVSNVGHFAGAYREVAGDIHYALGDYAAARAAYLQALSGPGADALDRNLVQMKLNQLDSAAAAEAA